MYCQNGKIENIIRLLQIKYQIAQKDKIFVITNNDSELQATVKKNTSDTSNHIPLQANRQIETTRRKNHKISISYMYKLHFRTYSEPQKSLFCPRKQAAERYQTTTLFLDKKT